MAFPLYNLVINLSRKEDRPTAKLKERRLIFLNPATIKLSSEPIDLIGRYKILLLSESIRENGLLFPVTVVKQGKHYRCVCGEKRVRASVLAGKKKIPCIEGIVCESELYKAVKICHSKQEPQKEFLESLLKKHKKEKLATCLCLTTRELDLLLCPKKEAEEIKEEPKKENKLYDFKLIKDKRFFINSIRKAVDNMKEAGVSATLNQKETAKTIEIKVSIKKSAEDFLQEALPDFTA